MTIYERIKSRRLEIGLSADTVADALGVSRATVYRYESSAIEKMPTTCLEPLSKVLRCSPGYLMGWDDKPNQLSQDEDMLLSSYRKLNSNGKKKLIERGQELYDLGYVEKGEESKMA